MNALKRVLGVLAAGLMSQSYALAQAYLEPNSIGQMPITAWTTYHGDYSGRHFSPLTRLRPSTIDRLSLAWTYRANTSASGALSGGTVEKPVPITLSAGALSAGLLKATPLMVNGILYLSAPDNAWAIDARTGREIWHYFWRTSGGDYIGNRGMAMYKGWLYFGTPDGHLVSLDAATGRERWHKRVAPVEENFYLSAAPVVIGNHLIVGLSGDASDVPAWLESRDLDTGELQWQWFVTPRTRDDPALTSWPTLKASLAGGGMTWQPVTFDPKLNLIFVATGNPDPSYAPEKRVGDNLYTCSLVALDVDNGKMRWYYQTSPNEAWDFDSNQVPVLFDARYQGKMRHLVAQATRNGMYFLLDRESGEHLLSSQVAESANWAIGFNSQGQPVRDAHKVGGEGGTLISPSNGGAQNWTPPAFLPDAGMLYMNVMQGFDVHYTYGPSIDGARGHSLQAVGGYDLSLRALDVLTGKARWIHRYAGSEWNPPRPNLVGGLLATAGGLVFAGAPAGGLGGFMVAYDPLTARQLWHATLPALPSNTPISFLMDNQQYLVFAANDTLYAFKLTEG